MPQTFEEYRQIVQTEADKRAAKAESRSLCDHLHAFNFGRVVGHMDVVRSHFWLRVRWLLMGAAVGIAAAAACLQMFLSGRILQFIK